MFPLDAGELDAIDSVEIERDFFSVMNGFTIFPNVSFLSNGDRRGEIAGGTK